jgi:membrane protein
MGRFCKFCGNPIEDGQECNCEGAVKERQEKAASSVSESANPVEEAPVNADANSTPEVTKDIEVKANESVSAVNNAPLPAQNAGSTGQAGSSAGKSLNIDVAKILKDTLGVTKSFLMNPFETLKSSFVEKDKLSQLVAGGISAFIMFIFFIIMFNYPVFDAFTKFKIAFFLILSYVAIKAVYAFGVFIFAKKQTKPVSYLSVLGLCSLTTILDMIILFLVVIFMSLSLYMLSGICLVFLLVNNIMSSVVIAYIAFEENFVKTYRIGLLLQLIIVCIVILLLDIVGRNILSSIYSSIFGNMNYMNMFGNVY